MINKDIIDMIVRKHNVQKITTKRLKIKSIHKDIIRLKQENRNIGDMVRSIQTVIYKNADKACIVFIKDKLQQFHVYEDRVKRDHTTIDYLEKLQMINSMLINKHRSKVKSLRSELQELKKELNDIKGEIK